MRTKLEVKPETDDAGQRIRWVVTEREKTILYTPTEELARGYISDCKQDEREEKELNRTKKRGKGKKGNL